MTKEEVRNKALMYQNANGICVSIPHPLMFTGDLIALSMLNMAKQKLPTEANPMRVLYDPPITFTYAETSRLHNESYLEAFVNMATEFEEVVDVVVFYN